MADGWGDRRITFHSEMNPAQRWTVQGSSGTAGCPFQFVVIRNYTRLSTMVSAEKYVSVNAPISISRTCQEPAQMRDVFGFDFADGLSPMMAARRANISKATPSLTQDGRHRRRICAEGQRSYVDRRPRSSGWTGRSDNIHRHCREARTEIIHGRASSGPLRASYQWRQARI